MTRPIFEAPHRLSNSKTNTSDDVEMVHDSVQRFTAEEITPDADLIDRTNSFPLDLWKKLGNLGVLMSGRDYERIILCGGPIGIMQACMDIVIPYVHERKQFGQPIGKFQLMQAKLADMYVNLNTARAYTYATASACASGKPSRKDTAGALLFSAERATSAALDAIQILGSTGYMNEYPTGRFLRDAKLYEIGGGTNEIRRMLIGRKLFEETQ